MNNRIKIGDVYFDLPEGALNRPTRMIAEKTDTPEMLQPVAFAPSEPDLISQYITRPATIARAQNIGKLPEVELDKMTEWRAFTGTKSTHPQQWSNYLEGKQRHCGFNTWAFLFGLQWFVFNKMYGKALVSAILEVAIAAMAFEGATFFKTSADFPQLGLPLAALTLLIGLSVPRLIIGYWANIALLRKATHEIKKVYAFNLDNERKLALISNAGSGSFSSLILLYTSIFLVRLIATSH